MSPVPRHLEPPPQDESGWKSNDSRGVWDCACISILPLEEVPAWSDAVATVFWHLQQARVGVFFNDFWLFQNFYSENQSEEVGRVKELENCQSGSIPVREGNCITILVAYFYIYRLLGQYIPPKNGICARAHISIRAGLGGISFDILFHLV